MVGQPLEDLAGHRAVEMDARALDSDDNLGGAGCGQYTEYASLTGARYRLNPTFPVFRVDSYLTYSG